MIKRKASYSWKKIFAIQISHKRLIPSLYKELLTNRKMSTLFNKKLQKSKHTLQKKLYDCNYKSGQCTHEKMPDISEMQIKSIIYTNWSS